MKNPHQVTRDFEAALCVYTGAPFAVCVNSCTSAIMLAVAYHCWRPSLVGVVPRMEIEIPNLTYVSVPMAIWHAGGQPTFRDEKWLGCYQLKPLPIWDYARWFTHGMYAGEMARMASDSKGPYAIIAENIPVGGDMLCVSFHASKTIGLEQGGAILHDNPEADAWLRRARFDGRTEGVAPKNDNFTQIGWHCYMNPSTAAQGILRLHSLPRHNEPLQNDDYPDLSLMDIFK
jgi:dTDP-4-amino-4,6-dideoxygalactose transaminase